MQCPLSRRITLRIILFLSVLFTAYFFYSLHQLKPPIRFENLSYEGRPGDNTTLILNKTLSQRLKKEHNLYPIKSRGATIFLDKDDVIRIPPNYILDVMEFRDLEETFDRYLGNIQTICKRMVHLGYVTDGGYDVCEDFMFATRPCLSYSFSTTGDYSFEKVIAETYNCEVHVYIPNADKVKPSTSSLQFHDITQYHDVNLAGVVDATGAEPITTRPDLKKQMKQGLIHIFAQYDKHRLLSTTVEPVHKDHVFDNEDGCCRQRVAQNKLKAMPNAPTGALSITLDPYYLSESLLYTVVNCSPSVDDGPPEHKHP